MHPILQCTLHYRASCCLQLSSPAAPALAAASVPTASGAACAIRYKGSCCSHLQHQNLLLHLRQLHLLLPQRPVQPTLHSLAAACSITAAAVIPASSTILLREVSAGLCPAPAGAAGAAASGAGVCAVQLAQCAGLLLPYGEQLLLVLQLLPQLLVFAFQLLYFTAGQESG